MGIPAKRRAARRWSLLVGCLLFTALVPLTAQEQPPLEILPNPVGVNDRFTVSFIVDTPSAATVAVGDWELPEGIRLYAGPYIRGIVETGPDGSSRPAVSVSYILRASSTGRIRFPSIPYTDGITVSETDVTILRVGSYRSGDLYMPLEVAWELPAPPYYEGQTIPAVLVLKNAEEILLPDKITVSASKGGFFEQAPELGEIGRLEYGGTVLYSVPVTGYLFTPTGPGRFFLNRAQVSAAGTTGQSEAVALDVVPLPAAAASSGAVGRFQINVQLSPETLAAGEEGSLRIRVSGRGNLSYLTLPKPDLGELTLLRSDEEHAYMPSGEGYTGYREETYQIQAENPGRYTINIPVFPQFNPETGRVERSRAEVRNIEVVPGAPAEEEVVFNPADLLYTPDQLQAAQSRELFERWQLYLFFLPGLLIYLITRLFRRGSSRKSAALLVPLLLLFVSAGGGDLIPDFNRADALFRQGDYQAAAELYGELTAGNRGNGRLLYNYGLSLEQNNERGMAAAAMLAAARRIGPEAPLLAAWNELAARGEYVRQYDLPYFFPPGVSFIMLLLFINLFFIAASVLRVRRRSLPLLTTLLAATLAIGAGGLFFHAQLQRRERVEIIGHDLVTRRIPRATAQEWIELPEGLAVRVTQSSGNFRLVETAYGVEGWVESDDLYNEASLPSLEEPK